MKGKRIYNHPMYSEPVVWIISFEISRYRIKAQCLKRPNDLPTKSRELFLEFGEQAIAHEFAVRPVGFGFYCTVFFGHVLYGQKFGIGYHHF